MRSAFPTLLFILLNFCVLLLCPTEGEAAGLLGLGVRFLTRKLYRIDAALRKRKEDVVRLCFLLEHTVNPDGAQQTRIYFPNAPKCVPLAARAHPKEWLSGGDAQSHHRGWVHPQAAQDPLWQEVQCEGGGEETCGVGPTWNTKLISRLGVSHSREGIG